MNTPHPKPTRRHFLGTLLAATATAGATGRLHAASAQGLDTLAATENVMHDFVVSRLMDSDGLCRSMFCAATRAPWTNEDLAKADPRLIRYLVYMFQNSPDKAGCISYENAPMATGEFAVSQIVRHRVTKDAAALELAHRAIRAILAVIEEGRHYMPGWLPKPFGGLRNARNSHETSTDQYTKVIVALHAWRPLADKDERAAIDRFFVDAADFFIARKFRYAYRHTVIVTADTHHHALGLFVPLLELAARTSGDAGYRKHFANFSAAMDASLHDEAIPAVSKVSSTMAGFNAISLMVEGYHVAMQAGCDDPRLPQTIKTLWQLGTKRVDASGDAYDDKPPRIDSQSTRLASIATIVEPLAPATQATALATKILGRQTDPQKMMNIILPETITETAITSWLVAYWRLREWAAR